MADARLLTSRGGRRVAVTEARNRSSPAVRETTDRCRWQGRRERRCARTRATQSRLATTQGATCALHTSDSKPPGNDAGSDVCSAHERLKAAWQRRRSDVCSAHERPRTPGKDAGSDVCSAHERPRTPPGATRRVSEAGVGTERPKREKAERDHRQRHHAHLAPHDRKHDRTLVGRRQLPDGLSRLDLTGIENRRR